jgi:hypothetical protein
MVDVSSATKCIGASVEQMRYVLHPYLRCFRENSDYGRVFTFDVKEATNVRNHESALPDNRVIQLTQLFEIP